MIPLKEKSIKVWYSKAQRSELPVSTEGNSNIQALEPRSRLPPVALSMVQKPHPKGPNKLGNLETEGF